MQITKNFFSKTVLSIALISISNLTFANALRNKKVILQSMRVLLQESGGLRYTRIVSRILFNGKCKWGR
jgi:copper resistance protein B